MNPSYFQADDVLRRRKVRGYVRLSKTSPFERDEPVTDDPKAPLLTHRNLLPWLDDYIQGKVSERDFRVFLYFLYALVDENKSAPGFDYVCRVACLVAMKLCPVGSHEKKAYLAFAKCLKRELGRLLTERHKKPEKRRFSEIELEMLTEYVLSRSSPSSLSQEEKELFLVALHKLASFGSGWAANMLGANYYGGPEDPVSPLGVKPDFRMAKKYYKLGSKLNYPIAKLNLGYIYFYGRCGKPDYVNAYKAFTEALAMGVAAAAYKLSDFYVDGRFVGKDKWMATLLLVKNYPLVFSSEDYFSIGPFAYRLSRLDQATNYGSLSNLFLGLKVYEQRAAERYNYGDEKVYKDLKADYEVKRIGATCVLNRPFDLPYQLSSEELCGCFGEFSPFWAQYRGSSRLSVRCKGPKGSQTCILCLADQDSVSSMHFPFLGADRLVKAEKICFQLTLREPLKKDYDDYAYFDCRGSDVRLYLANQAYHLESALLLAYEGNEGFDAAYGVDESASWIDEYSAPERLTRWYREAFEHEAVEQFGDLSIDMTQSYANSTGEFSFYSSFDEKGNSVFSFEVSSRSFDQPYVDYSFLDPTAMEAFKGYLTHTLAILLDLGLPQSLCRQVRQEIEDKYRSLSGPCLQA